MISTINEVIMQVERGRNQDLTSIVHRAGGERRYTVKLLEYTKSEYEFVYQEKSSAEFVFTDGFALSGCYRNGLWGVVSNGKYYCDDWSKDSKVFRKRSAFWEVIGKEFKLYLDNKPTRAFDYPVNLWFTIGEYWHWFCEDIPIIEQFRYNNYAIITNQLKDWQRESLQFFPDILDRLVEVETPCIVLAPEYHVFTYPAISLRGKTSHWGPEFLNKSFTPSQQKPATEKVYISRADAVARCVQNEDDVKAYLKTQGFRCYDNFSQISLQQKIDVFHGACIVVAPTGANLTHCHAMQPGSTVLDFNHKFELEAECGWNSIADAVGVNYCSFPAITGNKGPRSGKGKKRKNNHLIVDISKLQRALGAIS